MSSMFANLAEMVVSGQPEEIQALTKSALDQGVSPREILDQGLLAGMEIVGQRFKIGDMYVPEVLLSARTMHAALDILRPLLAETERIGAGTVVIGTVEGDIHNVGKDLVAMVLEGSGFKVVDLGVDVKPQTFVQAVREHQPDVLAMSALLSTTVPKMAETIQALQAAGLRDRVKVLAGGAPVTAAYVAQIGGDGYAPNAIAAVDKAKALLG
jgi:5-methyltetrahydrofolate--homocysteine methyltransferase